MVVSDVDAFFCHVEVLFGVFGGRLRLVLEGFGQEVEAGGGLFGSAFFKGQVGFEVGQQVVGCLGKGFREGNLG